MQSRISHRVHKDPHSDDVHRTRRNGHTRKNHKPLTRLEQHTSTKGGGWFEVRKAMMEDPAYLKAYHSLKLVELRLFIALLLHAANGDGRCWPSLKTLARYSVPNFDGRTVPSNLTGALKGLVAKGFVRKRKRGGRGCTNEYTMCIPSESHDDSSETPVSSTGVSNTGETNREHRLVRRSNTGETNRSNSYSTPSELHTRSRKRTRVGRGGVPSDGVSRSADERIIEAFLRLGVESRSLITTTLKEKGRRWMKALIALIEDKKAKGGIRSTAGFAVSMLDNPEKVRFERQLEENDTDRFIRETHGPERDYWKMIKKQAQNGSSL